jgi:hypothetical protein
VLGFVSLEMKAGGYVDMGTNLENPDFAAMARAMGIHAQRVEDPGELPGAVADMLAHDGPALLDVVTAKHELSMPPTIKPEQIVGFSSCGAPATPPYHRPDAMRPLSTSNNITMVAVNRSARQTRLEHSIEMGKQSGIAPASPAPADVSVGPHQETCILVAV